MIHGPYNIKLIAQSFYRISWKLILCFQILNVTNNTHARERENKRRSLRTIFMDKNDYHNNLFSAFFLKVIFTSNSICLERCILNLFYTWPWPWVRTRQHIFGGSIIPHVLSLGTEWIWMFSYTARPLYPLEQNPKYSLKRGLSETQDRSGYFGDKIHLLPLP
jgi:hypothetical protein